MRFIKELTAQGLLSFPGDMEAIELEPLNILIGPNGPGKSNVLEVLELLRATPADSASAIRDGGGVTEWLWKGGDPDNVARIEIVTGNELTDLCAPTERPLRYRLEFTSTNSRVEVLDEAFRRFFERIRRGEKSNFPRFKGHNRAMRLFDTPDPSHYPQVRQVPCISGQGGLQVPLRLPQRV